MTALFKFGDTIYQRTVKLNVRALTEPCAGCRAPSLSGGGVTCSAVRAGEQRMQLRLVQVESRGRRQHQVGRRAPRESRRFDVTLAREGAWLLASQCVNVRTGNPAVIGTCVP